MVARPDDFGGWGTNRGKYHPWKDPANQGKFKKDLARMIDLVLRGRAPAAKKDWTPPDATTEIAALPPVAVEDIEGQPIAFANLAGRVVVVEFWATWCPPCRSTLAWLSEVKRRSGERVEVIAVAVDSEVLEVRKLIGSLEHPPRVVMGTEALAASFGTITSVPTMFVFDQQGKTATVFYGAPEDLHLKAERRLNSLLK